MSLPKGIKLCRSCADCPFRKDVQFYLSPERRTEIFWSLAVMGESFTCHKLNSFDDSGEAVVGPKSQHCAGAMGFLHNIGCPNAAMQIGTRLGVWSPATLKNPEMSYATAEEFLGRELTCTEKSRTGLRN